MLATFSQIFQTIKACDLNGFTSRRCPFPNRSLDHDRIDIRTDNNAIRTAEAFCNFRVSCDVIAHSQEIRIECDIHKVHAIPNTVNYINTILTACANITESTVVLDLPQIRTVEIFECLHNMKCCKLFLQKFPSTGSQCYINTGGVRIRTFEKALHFHAIQDDTKFTSRYPCGIMRDQTVSWMRSFAVPDVQFRYANNWMPAFLPTGYSVNYARRLSKTFW